MQNFIYLSSCCSQIIVVSREVEAVEECDKDFRQTLKTYTEGVGTQPGFFQYVCVALRKRGGGGVPV